MTEIKYTIPLAPISKKNHQRIFRNSRTGRPFVMPSEAYSRYENESAWYLKPRPEKPIQSRVEVEALFYMPTHRRVDLTNLLESIDDILVHCGILEDDNCNIIVSHDGSRVLYDKENPRTEITIREIE